MVKKLKTIDSFFKRQGLVGGEKPLEPSADELRPSKVSRVKSKEVDNNERDMPLVSLMDNQCPSEIPRVESKEVDNNEGGMPLVSLVDDQRPSETPRVESKGVDGNGNYLERDPGLRRQIWEYPSNECDEI